MTDEPNDFLDAVMPNGKKLRDCTRDEVVEIMRARQAARQAKQGRDGAPILYHRTTTVAAQQILRRGFRDATETYGTGREFTGVWLSNVPLDVNEGAKGDTLLCITAIPERVISKFEWIEEGKPYREWLVPARLINKFGTVALADEE